MKTNIEKVVSYFENGKGFGEYNLEDFITIYRNIVNKNILADNTAFVSIIEDRAFVIFSDKPQVRFVIQKEKGYFKKEDFNFLLHAEISGTRDGKFRFYDFIKEELQLNKIKLLIIFLTFVILLFFIDSIEMIITLNEMILMSITIFISIFLLFIVSQNDKNIDKNLMKDGLIYRYLQTDKYISYVSISIVFVCITNVALSYVDYKQIIPLLTMEKTTFDIIKRITVSFFTSLNIVFLAVCYISLVQYYFEKEKFLRLFEASESLLKESVDKYNENKGEQF